MDPAGIVDGCQMQAVQITSPAMGMIATLHDHDGRRIRTMVRDVERIVADPRRAERLPGYDDVFLATSGTVRVVFRRTDEAIEVLSVADEPQGVPLPMP